MARTKSFSTAKKQEEAVIVGVVTQHQRLEQAEEYLDELAFLAHTAGALVKKRFLQKLSYPNPRTFIGEGKLQEIADYVTNNEIDIVLFDDELSPSQIRNLEHTLKCKILDRSNLILDIFASRAQSAQAKFQVELAQTQYLLPRLTRMWTHLSKHKGGIGMKGPGESEIETDRRILRNTTLIDVSVNAESTSNTFVALPTAVGTRLVKKDWPEATLTRVLERAGRSTRSGCLLEAELDKVLYAFNFLILMQTTLLEVRSTELSVTFKGKRFSSFFSSGEECSQCFSSHARTSSAAAPDSGTSGSLQRFLVRVCVLVNAEQVAQIGFQISGQRSLSPGPLILR